MSDLPKQTKRRDLVKRFRKLGWTGPHAGVGDHPSYMEKDGRVQKIPNPHRGDIDQWLLKQILLQAGVSPDEWLGRTQKKTATGTSDHADDLDHEDEDEDVVQPQDPRERPPRRPPNES